MEWGVYDRVDDQGFHVTLEDGTSHVQAVDHVVVCAGQVSFVPSDLSHPNRRSLAGPKMPGVGCAARRPGDGAKGVIRFEATQAWFKTPNRIATHRRLGCMP